MPVPFFVAETFNSCVYKPYIEPHFGLLSDSNGRDPDFDSLVLARWYEYLAEGYLKVTESKMAASGSKDNETRVNEPVQLYLAYRRLARAKLEIRIYTRLLKSELGPSLQKRTFNSVYMDVLFRELSPDFEEITEQSIPAGGLFGASLEVSPV